jgi:hypothetical protein
VQAEAGSASHVPHTLCTWAEPALWAWAERGFSPVAVGLSFLFSEYIQILTNLKKIV